MKAAFSVKKILHENLLVILTLIIMGIVTVLILEQEIRASRFGITKQVVISSEATLYLTMPYRFLVNKPEVLGQPVFAKLETENGHAYTCILSFTSDPLLIITDHERKPVDSKIIVRSGETPNNPVVYLYPAQLKTGLPEAAQILIRIIQCTPQQPAIKEFVRTIPIESVYQSKWRFILNLTPVEFFPVIVAVLVAILGWYNQTKKDRKVRCEKEILLILDYLDKDLFEALRLWVENKDHIRAYEKDLLVELENLILEFRNRESEFLRLADAELANGRIQKAHYIYDRTFEFFEGSEQKFWPVLSRIVNPNQSVNSKIAVQDICETAPALLRFMGVKCLETVKFLLAHTPKEEPEEEKVRKALEDFGDLFPLLADDRRLSHLFSSFQSYRYHAPFSTPGDNPSEDLRFINWLRNFAFDNPFPTRIEKLEPKILDRLAWPLKKDELLTERSGVFRVKNQADFEIVRQLLIRDKQSTDKQWASFMVHLRPVFRGIPQDSYEWLTEFSASAGKAWVDFLVTNPGAGFLLEPAELALLAELLEWGEGGKESLVLAHHRRRVQLNELNKDQGQATETNKDQDQLISQSFWGMLVSMVGNERFSKDPPQVSKLAGWLGLHPPKVKTNCFVFYLPVYMTNESFESLWECAIGLDEYGVRVKIFLDPTSKISGAKLSSEAKITLSQFVNIEWSPEDLAISLANHTHLATKRHSISEMFSNFPYVGADRKIAELAGGSMSEALSFARAWFIEHVWNNPDNDYFDADMFDAWIKRMQDERKNESS